MSLPIAGSTQSIFDLDRCILGMTKEALAVPGMEGVKGLDQRRLEFVKGTGRSLTQMGFEFGENQLNRVEIGAVERQIAHLISLSGD
jgi:hypothetical protein